MTEELRVLIADDHPLVRFGARRALERDGFIVCAEADDATGALSAALKARPDVCLLDIRMPGSGIKAAEAISKEVPDCAIVMLTVSRSDSDLFAALRAGAVGYLLKDIDPDRLPHALRGVLEGESALPRHLVALLVDEFRQRSRHPRLRLVRRNGADLTEREWEVLELMRNGLSTSEIADALGLSTVTVKTDVAAILRKLRVSSRGEALRVLDFD
jgi:DNA-binding NarL/FixJ family response regulator